MTKTEATPDWFELEPMHQMPVRLKAKRTVRMEAHCAVVLLQEHLRQRVDELTARTTPVPNPHQCRNLSVQSPPSSRVHVGFIRI
jgi:hypothetical protein